MGGDLLPSNSKAPTFFAMAMKDLKSGNLDRIQIVKGWIDAAGAQHESIHDVVWSGDRKPGADGKLPPVGNTVDVTHATYTNSIGTGELSTAWTDPDFKPGERAFYYARVLEIPTPRWSTIDAARLGIAIPRGWRRPYRNAPGVRRSGTRRAERRRPNGSVGRQCRIAIPIPPCQSAIRSTGTLLRRSCRREPCRDPLRTYASARRLWESYRCRSSRRTDRPCPR